MSPHPTIDPFPDGLEFSVAVIESQGELIVAPVEVIPPEEGGLRILGAKTKIGNIEILKLIAHLPGNDGLLNDHAGGQHAMAAI